MKKFIACLLTIFLTATTWALPLGNPSEPANLEQGLFLPGCCSCPENIIAKLFCRQCIGFKAGFYGDYVFNRNLKVERRISPDVDKTRIITNAGILSLNICNTFDVFTTLGTSQISISTPRNSFNTIFVVGNGNLFIDSTSGFSWSFGLRGVLFEMGPLEIGGSLQYFHTKPIVHKVRLQGAAVLFFDDRKLPMKYQEYQAGIGLSYRIVFNENKTSVVPYIGVKWARCRVKMLSTLLPVATFQLFNLRENRDIGYALGLTLIGSSRIEAGVEVRFADETALHVNAQVRF